MAKSLCYVKHIEGVCYIWCKETNIKMRKIVAAISKIQHTKTHPNESVYNKEYIHTSPR